MAMKECNKCHIIKPLEDFHKHNQLKDGRRGTCKVCRTKELVADPRHKIRQRNWYENNKVRHKNNQLMLNYGITWTEYESLLSSQGGVCAICKNPPSPDKRLSVDHCHKTKRVRGLLCQKCNRGIGLFNDDRVRLTEAIKYLEVN